MTLMQLREDAQSRNAENNNENNLKFEGSNDENAAQLRQAY